MTEEPTDRVPRHDVMLPPSADGASFEIYKAASGSLVAHSLPEGVRAEDFFIDGANWQLPRAVVTRVRCSAHDMRRGPAEIARDDAPTLQMYLLVEGETAGLYDGRPVELGPGDIVVHDSRRGFSTRAGAFDARILMVPRDRVPLPFLSLGVHGMKLAGDEPGTRLLATWMTSLVEAIDGLTMAEADQAVMAIVQFAGSLIETQLMRSGDERRYIEPTLETALAYIERRLTDPNLSTTDVRAHLGISRSGVYRMFEPFGGIEAAIRQRRLDVALHVMLSQALPNLPLPELARRHGYRRASNFARAFEARFGVQPAEMRAKVMSRDSDWLRAQAIRAGFATLEAWIAALPPIAAAMQADAGRKDPPPRKRGRPRKTPT